MKRSSKKSDYLYSQRRQEHSITSASTSKIPVARQSTLMNFCKQKALIELPRILPIHNNTRHKRYLQSCFVDVQSQLNLVGTKFMKHVLKDRKHVDIQTPTQSRNQGSLLEKQQSHKQNFLKSILAEHSLSNVYFSSKEKFKVFVDDGNNSRLIKELIRRRSNLRLVSEKREANIVWTQFCDWQQSNMGSLFTELSSNNHNQQNLNQRKTQQISARMKPYKGRQILITDVRMHNHLKNHYQISDKKCLFKNIKKWCKSQKVNQQQIIPKTYHIDGNDKDLPLDICQTEKFWIVKPGEDTNRGTGITVQQGRQNILHAIRQLSAHGKSSLVQQYIDPLLYKNRKFDIRCYALITSFCGNLKAYWYREGYLRTCCKEFSYDSTNIYGHLTNDAVQKKHKHYGKFEPYNKLSFNDLDSFLKSKEISYQDTLSRMKELALISIRSAQDKLKAEKNIFAFQIFGYDFLIDSRGKIWLIEVNTNPCLQFSGSLLSRVIWHMVENSLAIAIDPLIMQIPEPFNSWRQKMDKIYTDNKFECII